MTGYEPEDPEHRSRLGAGLEQTRLDPTDDAEGVFICTPNKY